MVPVDSKDKFQSEEAELLAAEQKEFSDLRDAVTAEEYDFIRQQDAYRVRIIKLIREIEKLSNKYQLKKLNCLKEKIVNAYEEYHMYLRVREFYITETRSNRCMEYIYTPEYFNQLVEPTQVEPTIKNVKRYWKYRKECATELKNIKKELECLENFPIKFKKYKLSSGHDNRLYIGRCWTFDVFFLSAMQSKLLEKLVINIDRPQDFKKIHQDMKTVLLKMDEAQALEKKLDSNSNLVKEAETTLEVKLSFKERLRYYIVLPVKNNKKAFVSAIVFGLGMSVDAVLFKYVKSYKDLFSNHLHMVVSWALALLTLSFVFKVIATGRSGMVFDESFARVNIPKAVSLPGNTEKKSYIYGEGYDSGSEPDLDSSF